MKVALVHDWLLGMRGGERCLEVACRLFPEAQLFTLLRREQGLSDTIARMRWQASILQRFPGIHHYYRWMLPLMPTAIERLRIPADVDLVLSFSHAVAHGVLCPPGAKHICYCFTPMRYAWEMRQSYFGAGASGGKRSRLTHGAERLVAPIRDRLLDRVRNWTLTASRRVTHFVSISQTIADRIADCFGRSSTIIFPPVDTNYYTPAPEARENFYLCVSALVPYKRIDLAVEACNRLGRRLIVIGTGPHEKRLRQMAGPTVSILGWQSNEVIRDHYRRCRALVFPGLEDFGIVPLEAQACGAPVIAYGHGGAKETVVDLASGQPATGLLFGEQSAEDLARAIEQIEANHQSFATQAARTNAEKFRAEFFEQQLRSFIDRVMREQPGNTQTAHENQSHPHIPPGEERQRLLATA